MAGCFAEQTRRHLFSLWRCDFVPTVLRTLQVRLSESRIAHLFYVARVAVTDKKATGLDKVVELLIQKGVTVGQLWQALSDCYDGAGSITLARFFPDPAFFPVVLVPCVCCTRPPSPNVPISALEQLAKLFKCVKTSADACCGFRCPQTRWTAPIAICSRSCSRASRSCQMRRSQYQRLTTS